MHLISTVPVQGGSSEIRIYRCPDCSHELRLTVWGNDVSAVEKLRISDPARRPSPDC
jgi:hypothetical protein